MKARHCVLVCALGGLVLGCKTDPNITILERELRDLRKALAAKAAVPNYMIFSDKTLYDLVERSPKSEAALLGVFGMGEVKAGRYGADILSAIVRSSARDQSAL